MTIGGYLVVSNYLMSQYDLTLRCVDIITYT